jgi:hypothetical protein
MAELIKEMTRRCPVTHKILILESSINPEKKTLCSLLDLWHHVPAMP